MLHNAIAMKSERSLSMRPTIRFLAVPNQCVHGDFVPCISILMAVLVLITPQLLSGKRKQNMVFIYLEFLSFSQLGGYARELGYGTKPQP